MSTNLQEKSLESHVDFYKRWGELNGQYFKWQLDQFEGCVGNRICDVGCALGNFTPFFLEKEIYLAVEPNPDFVEVFNDIYKGTNAKLSDHGDICKTETAESIRNEEIDTIICTNVIEHIKEDDIALKNMIYGVKEGGHVCLIVPAMPFLFGTLDILDGHYRRYTKGSLKALAGNFPNVEIKKCYYLNMLGALGWFVKGRILKEKHHKNENFVLMSKILPIVSYCEKRMKPPFGLSVVMVLKKIGPDKTDAI